MSKTILFIHGMFQNAKSWDKWAKYFTARGYHCIVPSWPDHEGDPADLRANPPASLGGLHLETVIRKMEEVINTLPEKPIVIGHSVGGLITQILANKGLLALGVPVSSVAPNKMMTFDWDFFKNSAVIANPFKGSEPICQDPEMFHGSFCNTLDEAAAKKAFDETATHDSRNIFRDCLTETGEVDLEQPHPPLLFITGEEDKIIPHELVEKNTKAYENQEGILYKLFSGRSHYICNEPGWEEVVDFVDRWITEANVYIEAGQEYSDAN
jgi:pimeloyl-ACP methyl ester carboxylesterase